MKGFLCCERRPPHPTPSRRLSNGRCAEALGWEIAQTPARRVSTGLKSWSLRSRSGRRLCPPSSRPLTPRSVPADPQCKDLCMQNDGCLGITVGTTKTNLIICTLCSSIVTVRSSRERRSTGAVAAVEAGLTARPALPRRPTTPTLPPPRTRPSTCSTTSSTQPLRPGSRRSPPLPSTTGGPSSPRSTTRESPPRTSRSRPPWVPTCQSHFGGTASPR